jgi:hypothetical protein
VDLNAKPVDAFARVDVIAAVGVEMGGDADDVQAGLIVHLDRRGIAMLRRNLPLVSELLEALRVDVGRGEQFRVLTAPIAGRMRMGPAPNPPMGPAPTTPTLTLAFDMLRLLKLACAFYGIAYFVLRRSRQLFSQPRQLA